LRRDAWGQRYAFEAAEAVIAWARTQGFSALIAGHHPENEASKRTLIRLGFAYTHDELYPPTGQMEPCYLLTIDKPVEGST
jgi:ribosomal-protein-alanine N-acetyltransferase